MKAWNYITIDFHQGVGQEYSKIVLIIVKADRGKAIALYFIYLIDFILFYLFYFISFRLFEQFFDGKLYCKIHDLLSVPNIFFRIGLLGVISRWMSD